MPEISVVLTFFNESTEILKRGIDSILNQTFKDIEFIIYPGNPDNKAGIELVTLYSKDHPLIKLLLPSKKESATFCINEGIRKAGGKYVAMQEADDESLPERLEKQYMAMENNPAIDVTGTGIQYIDEYTKEILVKRIYPGKVNREFNRYQAIAQPTAMMKRELFEKYGYYDDSLSNKMAPDYDFWLRWHIQDVRFHNLQEVLFNYYQSKDNGRNKFPKKALLSTIKVKLKYRSKLHFGFMDYVYLSAEIALLCLPKQLIGRLFYIWQKIKK